MQIAETIVNWLAYGFVAYIAAALAWSLVWNAFGFSPRNPRK